MCSNSKNKGWFLFVIEFYFNLFLDMNLGFDLRDFFIIIMVSNRVRGCF